MTLVALPLSSWSLFLTGKCLLIMAAVVWTLRSCTTWHHVHRHHQISHLCLSAQLFQQSPPLLQLSWCTVAPKPWNTPFVFVYLPAGDPVCSKRLHTVLVLYSQRGWIFFIGDQADAAERPRPVLHTVGQACMHAFMLWVEFTHHCVLCHAKGRKRWTGSLTSPLAWLTTLPLIYGCSEKPKIALQTERTSKVS